MTAPFVTHAARSDRGHVKDTNQDAYACHAERGLFAVADGHSGNIGGATAAQLAVDGLQNVATPEELLAACRKANQTIFERARIQHEFEGMGTTLTALWLTGDPRQATGHAWIAHVGDSRCYRLREGSLKQLTPDHVSYQRFSRKISGGFLGLFPRYQNVVRPILRRSVGPQPEVEFDLIETDACAGDLFLLCSDGLTGELEESRILELLTHPGDLEGMADRLLRASMDAGGGDNITIVLAQVG
jgi:serine/threonine protein phosphatase PrpC